MPVFMKVWAGSWLIASVCIERMMQISSAIVAEVREDRRRSPGPTWPHFWNGCCGREAGELGALELGDRLALGERLRHRLAVHLGQLRLVVERLQVRRPAGHVQVDDALGLRREVERVDDALPALRLARAASAAKRRGLSSDARATQPMPAAARPRKARRVWRKTYLVIEVSWCRVLSLSRRIAHEPRP